MYKFDEYKRINIPYEYYINNDSEYFSEFIYDLITELAIFNIEKIVEYLASEDPKKKQRALKLAIVDKPYFTIDDIADFIKIENSIKNNFNENGEIQIAKSKLTSREKEIWRCKCGNSNNVDAQRCNCGLDRMGFYEGETTSDTAIDILHGNIDLIQRTLIKK